MLPFLSSSGRILTEYNELKKKNNNEIEILISKKKSDLNIINGKIKIANKEKDENKNAKIDELKRQLSVIAEQWNKSINSKINNNSTDEDNYLDEICINEDYFNQIKNINFNLEMFISEARKILKKLKKQYITLVNYFYDINIFFKYDYKNDKTFLIENLYIFNMGDFVLISTIKKISRKISEGKYNKNKFLLKILGIEKINDYSLDSIKEDEISLKFPSFEKLNDSQRKAFLLSVDETDEIAIIHGPPGTGKTEVITELVKYFNKDSKKVLITSQANVAIKNVVDKLTNLEKIENSVITLWLTKRQGNKNSEEHIRETWHNKIFSNFEFEKDNWKSIYDEFLNEKEKIKIDDNVLSEISFNQEIKTYAATTTTSDTLKYEKDGEKLNIIDVLIIDEVSKCTLPEILRYGLNSKKVILVGDHKQLNPIFDLKREDFENTAIFSEEKFNDLKEVINRSIFYSLFKKAQESNRVVTLNENYRSLPGILEAYNVFYEEEGKLIARRKADEYSKNFIFSNSNYFNNKKCFYFFNLTGKNREKVVGTSRKNDQEIKMIFDILNDLKDKLEKSNEKTIAIIFMYAAQIREFNRKLNTTQGKEIKKYFGEKMVFDTVDSFQGSEADIVILSTVITEWKKANRSFLRDFRRINVSLSRAKDMLIVIGSEKALKEIEMGGEEGQIEHSKYFKQILSERNRYFLKINRVFE